MTNMEENTPPASEDEVTTPHGAKNDPFVTLRMVIIVVVPLILIVVLTGLDQQFFSLFTDTQEKKESPAPQEAPDEANKSQSTPKPAKTKIVRSNKPPP